MTFHDERLASISPISGSEFNIIISRGLSSISDKFLLKSLIKLAKFCGNFISYVKSRVRIPDFETPTLTYGGGLLVYDAAYSLNRAR